MGCTCVYLMSLNYTLKMVNLALYVFYLKTIMSDESPSHTLCESRNLLFFSFPVEKHVFRLLGTGGT